MRKIFKTAVAAVATTAMVATLFAGIGTAPVSAATGNVLSGVTWTHTHDAWETNGNDALIGNTVVKDKTTGTGFDASISMTGWQQNWVAEKPPAPEDAYVWDNTAWGDKPYQLTSEAEAYVTAGKTYTLKLTVDNQMTTEKGVATDKSFTVTIDSGIEGDTDNTMLFKTYTVPANSTETFTEEIPISGDYQLGKVAIQIAYGSYVYSKNVTDDLAAGKITQEKYDEIVKAGYLLAPNTSQEANLKGNISFAVELNGEIAEKPTEKPSIDLGGQEQTTASTLGSNNNNNGQQQTEAPKNNNDNTGKVTKPAKVRIKSVKNLKGKKVKITWKKVKGASKYQVKVGTKKKSTSKLTYTMKGLKKNKTYKVYVRAYKKNAGYGAWSKVKKVKIRK